MVATQLVDNVLSGRVYHNWIMSRTGSGRVVTVKEFSEMLPPLQYGVARQFGTKDGSWTIYSRQNYVQPSFLPREGAPSDSVVAMYSKKNPKELQSGFLFMTAPGTAASLEEVVNNANITTEELLEKQWAISKPFFLSLGAAALVGPTIVEGLNYALGSPLSLGQRITSDIMMAIAGVAFDYGTFYSFSENRFERNATKVVGERMSHPQNYLYGGVTYDVISREIDGKKFEERAQSAYAVMQRSGIQIDRQDFYRVFVVISQLSLQRSEQIAALGKVPVPEVARAMWASQNS